MILLPGCLLVGGCARMRPRLKAEYVFCTAKQGLLRDRIAAVSNRTGTVNNGEKLEVLEHGRRFIKVKTPRGEVGWLDEKSLATQATADTFETLRTAHKDDPTIASAVVRDEVYLHEKPGRETERFFRLAEGDKLKLLQRATLLKPLPAGLKAAAAPAAKAGKAVEVPLPPAAPPMEDWWLVRDAHDRTGWIYSRMMEVDAPDTLTRYAEGQHFVGAYLLTTVFDAEAPQEDKNIPVYLTVLSPYKAGLPYDFDQVRLFTWSTKRHRYETGFREKNVEGYLPVTIGRMKDPSGRSATAQMELPSFSYRLLAADAGTPVPDPVTGAVVPGRLVTRTWRLDQNTVMRVGGNNDEVARPVVEERKKKKGKKG